jgi:site-specific DNA-methyltransferase (cytosine-N4-specific)
LYGKAFLSLEGSYGWVDGRTLRTELEKQDTKPDKKAKSKSYPERQLAKMLKDQPLTLPETNHHLIIGDSRRMLELADESVHLIVTSPPYPMIEIWDGLFAKMGCQNFNAMHVYLAQVWSESYRVLVDGGIACINIGDALRKVDDTFQLYPNHVKVIEHCEALGFTSLPYILWKKPTSRANAFLGSGFIPPNAYVTQDCEFILVFRKGQPRPFPPKDLIRYASHYTISERNTWFTQIWQLPGARQHIQQVQRRVAAFPEEIAYRLIRMFSVIGDTVVDPFLGTGTTMKVAMENHRNSVGYEIDEKLIPIIERRLGKDDSLKPRRRQKKIQGYHITRQSD